MAASDAASPLTLGLLAGGFSAFGVLLKIGYDALAARRASKHEAVSRFASERREAYERFYGLVRQQRIEATALRKLVVAHHEGKTEISDEEQASVPPSVLSEMASVLDQIRGLARTYEVIKAAETIVRLFGDMALSQPSCP